MVGRNVRVSQRVCVDHETERRSLPVLRMGSAAIKGAMCPYPL